VKQIYRISGGHFKVANKKYSKLSHDYDLTFATTTLITPITDPTRIAAFPTQQPDFLPLSQLASREHDDVVGTGTTAHAHDAQHSQHSRKWVIAAVIGFVQAVGALGSITAKTTGNVIPKRSVFLEDQTRSIVELTLWYDDAKNAATLFKVPLPGQRPGSRRRALTHRGSVDIRLATCLR
jgi:hypothetical protein